MYLFMLLFVILNIVVQRGLIFPNKPYQLYEIKWSRCDKPEQQQLLDFNKLDQKNYLIDNKSICSNNIIFDIPDKNLYYYFVFAANIQNKLTITIDENKYIANLDRLQNINNIVILHSRDQGKSKLPINIKIEGMNNYFQQLYIFQFKNNETKIVNKILYYDQDHIKTYFDEEKLEIIKLLSLESNILNQKYIIMNFYFEFHKVEQLLCHFNIPEQENVTIHSLNDKTVQLTSQLEIKQQLKYKNIDFILRVESQVQIKQIFGGNMLDYTYPFELIFQTDGQNNLIQTFINQSYEKIKLLSEIAIINFPQNQTLFIEIKPQGIECPKDLSISLIYLKIKNNSIQWTYLQQSFFNNCQIFIEHSFSNEGQYFVEVSAKMVIQDLTFYLENQGQFSIYYVQPIENHLEMVLIVFFGTIILLLSIFVVLLKKYDKIIYSKWDLIYFKRIFTEEENQNGQQQ